MLSSRYASPSNRHGRYGFRREPSPNDHHKQTEYGSRVYQASSISRNASTHTLPEPSQWHLSQQSLPFQSSPLDSLSRSAQSLSALDDRQAVKIAIICALPKEADAVLAAFGRRRDDRRTFGKTPGDPNAYTLCFVEDHPLVVAHMPGAGKALAASVAAYLKISFSNIQLALLVGICGGVPGDPYGPGEVRLGDVVISQSIVQYDYGKQYPEGFERKPTTGSSSRELRATVSQLETDYYRDLLQERLCLLVSDLQKWRKNATYPGLESDRLYEPSYLHKHRDTHCNICESQATSSVCRAARELPCARLGCEEAWLVSRPAPILSSDGTKAPSIHIGTIGSGDEVMKSGTHRDAIAQKEGIIAFEMEGAGLVDEFPCLVIKGVADYADSHKNDVWHHYASATAACCARAFLETYLRDRTPEYGVRGRDSSFLEGSPDPLMSSQESEPTPCKETQTRSAFWHVPVPRKSPFAGRVHDLAALEAAYTKPDCTSISLLGLGGVGKSNLALEFAYSLREHSPGVSIFWISASDALNFDNGYAEIGRQLQISSMAEVQTDVKLLIKRHLSQESFGQWLLIIDNVDDFSLFFGIPGANRSRALNNFVPRSPHGCTLITTRDRKVALSFSREHSLKISCLDHDSARSLLTSSLQTPPSDSDLTSVDPLLDRLACLPLAIVQATAYINLNNISIGDYVDLLDGHEDNVFELLDEDFVDEVRAPEAQNSIISTWKITFEDIAHRSTLAKDYLSLIACIDSKNIPQRFLPQGSSRKQTIDATGLLTGYSFLTQRESDSGNDISYDMHSLVHLACRSWLRDDSGLEVWARSALCRMLEIFPKPDHVNRSTWSLYLPHASRLLQSDHTADMDDHFELRTLVGQCLFLEGKYRDAVADFKLVVEHREKTLEPLDHNLLRSYTRLAQALERCNRCEEAIKFNQKALRGFLETLRPDDPLVLRTFANIASVKRRQHKWTDAEGIDRRVLEARLKVLGANEPDTLSSMANLGSTYRNMRLIEKAEDLLSRVVEGQRVVLGEDHPEFLMAQASLASTYRYSGRLQEAETLEINVMNQRKKILGIHHPDTFRSMANLASTYRAQKRLEHAEDLEKEVLKLRTSVLGEEDPDTMTAMGNLASTYRSQGKYAEAEELDKHALELKKRILGPEDHSTLATMSSLASTYWRSNRQSESDALSKEVLKGCQHALGERHPQTLASMVVVAYIFRREGRLNAAASLAERVIKERERALGPNHKLTQEMKRFLSIVNLQRKRRRVRREQQTR